MSDITTLDKEQRETHFLTRSLSAFVISAVAKVDDDIAALSVVDESQDDGIDAFYFSKTDHIAYLVQSKWAKNGNGTIDLGSVLKFIKGVEDLLANRTNLLGPKMQNNAADINSFLTDSQAGLVLVVAYTGKADVAPEVRQPLDKLLKNLNDDQDFVSLQILRQKELHDIVEREALGKSIDVQVMLHEYGAVSVPYQSYYGQMDALDIASWSKYGDQLYHKNIRSFKGSTDVNDAIAKTLQDRPENFLYFNNGITLLCTELKKQPLGGSSRSSGVFDCKGISVVNGAQTVGSIIQAGDTLKNKEQLRVMVRLISLEGCPPDFGHEVTRATNTQNRIEKRDFAALDKEQSRLKSELWLSLGKEYVFRTGDHPPAQNDGCTIDEATPALACAHLDVGYSVAAKSNIGKLYEDVEQPPYTVLFNPSLTAVRLWRSVQVLRAVELYLRGIQSTAVGKDRLLSVHGNRMVLHLVFRKLAGNALEADYLEFDKVLAKIPEFAKDILSKVAAEYTKSYASSYPANLFKNATKCKAMAANLV
jgi:hypothetical protein